jgi:hypothetical protein
MFVCAFGSRLVVLWGFVFYGDYYIVLDCAYTATVATFLLDRVMVGYVVFLVCLHYYIATFLLVSAMVGYSLLHRNTIHKQLQYICS